MSEISSMVVPHSWAVAELESIAAVSYGKALSASTRSKDGVVPVIGSSGVVGSHNEALVDGPCLVVGRKGAAGAVHLVTQSSWPIDTAYFIQPPHGIDLSYLHYFLSSQQLGRLDKSTAIPSLSRDDLYRVEVPVAPESEQDRIIQKLEELLSDLDAGVAELKAAQRKLTQYRQSLLKAAVEGALTADWRAARNTSSRRKPGSSRPRDNQPQKRDPGLRRDDEGKETGAELLQRILSERRTRWEQKQLAKFAEQGKTPSKGWQDKYPEPLIRIPKGLPSLPEGWAWASLDQLTEFVTSGSRGWADHYTEKGATFIRSQNINRDFLDLSDIAFVNPPRTSEGTRTRVQRSDLLLTITGANVGKAAVVDVELEEAYVSQHVALMRPVDSGLSEYLHLFLTCNAGGRGQLNKMAYGAGKPGLNLQQVQSVTVPVPNTHELPRLLHVLGASLDATSAQTDSIACGLRQAAAQRKNILKAAFSGQLVPQDPNDEPANALLARIRAQCEASAGTPARKRGRKARGAA